MVPKTKDNASQHTPDNKKRQMIQLEKAFKYKGNTFTQIERTEKAAIYKRECPGLQPYFEVFKIIITPQYERFGKVWPAKENYPTDNAFGDTAWCCNTYERANERFNELNK